MADSDQSKAKASLKAVGRIGKKSKNKLKLAKKKRRAGGKGKIRGKRNLWQFDSLQSTPIFDFCYWLFSSFYVVLLLAVASWTR